MYRSRSRSETRTTLGTGALSKLDCATFTLRNLKGVIPASQSDAEKPVTSEKWRPVIAKKALDPIGIKDDVRNRFCNRHRSVASSMLKLMPKFEFRPETQLTILFTIFATSVN